MGRQTKKEYPEWIQKHRTEGTTIKEIGGKYYLYKQKTSKRVEGKKNPQPVYEFLGTITEDGLVPPRKRRLDVTSIQVREFGFTYALENRCPEAWRSVQGKNWKERLMAIIISRSKNTYLLDMHEHIRSAEEMRLQLGTMTSSLGRRLKEAYGLELSDFQKLDTIYLLRMDGELLISRIDEEQKAILDKIDIHLEVPKGFY